MTLLRPWEAGLVLRAPGQLSDHVHTGVCAGAQGSNWGAGNPVGESKTERVWGSPSATMTSRVFFPLLCSPCREEARTGFCERSLLLGGFGPVPVQSLHLEQLILTVVMKSGSHCSLENNSEAHWE